MPRAVPAGQNFQLVLGFCHAVHKPVRSAFEELTGMRLDANIGHLPIPAYRTGSGISDGVVDGDWWHDVGQALLLDRWNVASASERRAR